MCIIHTPLYVYVVIIHASRTHVKRLDGVGRGEWGEARLDRYKISNEC